MLSIGELTAGFLLIPLIEGILWYVGIDDQLNIMALERFVSDNLPGKGGMCAYLITRIGSTM